MEKNRPILVRNYYALRIELRSPLCISGGQSEMTDADVLVNGSGEVFVPGTSLAGAFRNYLEQDKKTRGIFGFSEGEKGQMSSVFVSDLYFDQTELKENKGDEDTGTVKGSNRRPAVVSVRDGVKLTDEKTVDNKFDMEIIETGARGMLYLNVQIREGDPEALFDKNIADLFGAIQDGEIRLGSNKNRGFGRLHIEKIYHRAFRCGEDAFPLKDWIAFRKNAKVLSFYPEPESFEAWNRRQEERANRKYLRICVPLQLTGGISIRRYSTEPGKADFEHITCNGDPVIPGSSWNGAIRSDVKRILISLGMTAKRAETLIHQWFGMIATDAGKEMAGESERSEGAAEAEKNASQSLQSRVVVGESVLEGAVRLPMTRNRINRFDASTKDGALYSELAYFGGKTTLELLVRKDRMETGEDHAFYALIGVLDMAIRDIAGGYVAVGGQTAVGRGIFAPDPELPITYSEEISMDTCMEELYSLL